MVHAIKHFLKVWPYLVLIKYRRDRKERATHCETTMMREAMWAWAKAMPPLQRVKYLTQHVRDGKRWWGSNLSLFVLSPCPLVSVASSPGPIEGHHWELLGLQLHAQQQRLAIHPGLWFQLIILFTVENTQPKQTVYISDNQSVWFGDITKWGWCIETK